MSHLPRKTTKHFFLRREVARLSGVGSETLRYYEKIGLLLKPPRSEAGYRHYPPSIFARLRLVQSAKSLGFSLEEINELLSWRDERNHPCADVQRRATEKLQELDKKMEELAFIRAELSRLVELCSGDGSTEQCVILRSMAQEPVSCPCKDNQVCEEADSCASFRGIHNKENS